jgi:hypothetical protein
MKRKTILAAGLAVLVILLFTSMTSAQTSVNYDAVWSRFAAGGGTRQSTNYMVQDILGQWVFENPASPSAQIITDFFWAGDSILQQRYLPVIVR